MKIRSNIEGWSVPHSSAKVQLPAYSDDITFLIKDQNDITVLEKVINEIFFVVKVKRQCNSMW